MKLGLYVRTLTLTFSLAITALGGGCGFGGLNDNVHQAGDEPGGVKLAAGDIAVSPDGEYFVFKHSGKLAVGWVGSGEVAPLPVNSPGRLSFSATRHVVYVTTTVGTLHAIDVDERSLLWTSDIEIHHDPMVVSSKDDARVVVGGKTEVSLHDASDGEQLATRHIDTRVVDLEILPDDLRALVVAEHRVEQETGNVPTTRVHVIQLDTGQAHDFGVPNCSDDIIVPKHGKMALLAPTTCFKDPISYIDLTPGDEKFVRNLPGFGPVALGPDGTMAVGFLDMNIIDVELFDDPNDVPSDPTRYQLMVIDTESLSYDFYAYGNNPPRYAMTPDGNVLLVDDSGPAKSKQLARMFDLEERNYIEISGAKVSFDHLTFSSGSRHAYLLSDMVAHAEWGPNAQGAPYIDYKLYDLDVPGATVSELPTTFRPRNVNLSPTDDMLFLRRDEQSICIYSLVSKTCERNVNIIASL